MRRQVIVCLFLLFSPVLRGQEFEYLWKHINVNNGLSNNLVLDVKTDFEGNVWILTSKGLDVYRNNVLTNVCDDNFSNLKIFKSHGKCYMKIKNKFFLCRYPFVKVAQPHPGWADQEVQDSALEIRDGILFNKGKQILDRKIGGYMRQGDLLYVYTDYEGIFYTDINAFRIINFSAIEKERISDLVIFNEKLYIATQVGRIMQYDGAKFRNIDFHVRHHSPGIFFKSERAIFSFTGKIDSSDHITPYHTFYYCYDIDDDAYLQLGHIGASVCSRNNVDKICIIERKKRIDNFVMTGSLIYLFSDSCYFRVDVANGYNVTRKDFSYKVSHRNSQHVIAFDHDTIKIFSDFENSRYKSVLTHLRGVLDVYEKDSFLFVFNANAFVMLNKITGWQSLPVYYADIGLNHSYSASNAGPRFLYVSDGNNLVRYDYRKLLKDGHKITGKPVSEQFYSYVITLPGTDAYEIMNKFSYAILLKNDDEFYRSYAVGEKFYVSKFSPGEYRLVVYDKFGNILFSDAVFKVPYTYLAGLWFLSFVILALVAAVIWLLYKNRLRLINEKYSKKEMDYNISLKQKLSVSIPHLYNNLFNSLSTIDEEGNIEKYNMISSFSSTVLQYNAKDEVSLAEEMFFCARYSQLFQCVKKDLRFFIRVSNHAEMLPDDIVLPTFIIQPILENSFTRYKTGSKHNGVYLHVTIYKTHLEILLSDDFSLNDKDRKGTGFGLKIVGERIDNLDKRYKGKVSIKWSFRKKGGIYTKMNIPYEK